METPDALAAERQTHAQALQLLSQARDYLMRLPVVPATREMARQIDDFLTDPAAKLAQLRAQGQLALEKEQRTLALTWHAGTYTAAGAPLLLVEVNFERPSGPDSPPTPEHRILTIAGHPLKRLANGQVVTPRGDRYPALRLWLRPADSLGMRPVPKEGGE